MKKTDLVKNLGLKIQGKMRAAGVPGRFGEGAAQLPDRREQRKLDQAAGLVPFAVKLHGELVRQLQAQAQAEGVHVHALTERLLRAGLAAEPAAVPPPAPKAATPKAPAKKAPAKKVPAKKVPAKKVAS